MGVEIMGLKLAMKIGFVIGVVTIIGVWLFLVISNIQDMQEVKEPWREKKTKR